MTPFIQMLDGERINLNSVCRIIENDNASATVYFSDGAIVNYHGENMKIILTASLMNQQIFDQYLRQIFAPENKIIVPS